MYTSAQLQHLARLALLVRAHSDVLASRIDGLRSFNWTAEAMQLEHEQIKKGIAAVVEASEELEITEAAISTELVQSFNPPCICSSGFGMNLSCPAHSPLLTPR